MLRERWTQKLPKSLKEVTLSFRSESHSSGSLIYMYMISLAKSLRFLFWWIACLCIGDILAVILCNERKSVLLVLEIIEYFRWHASIIISALFFADEKYSIVRSVYPSELHIRGVNKEDALRKYICSVESIIRHRDRTPDMHNSPEMRVKLNTPGGYLQTYMQISHRHAVISALKGTSVELPCVFHGSAVKVYYRWYRSNQKVNNSRS